ncbi:MAG: hypothetical protein H6814_09725 [Phycisphaeraceae bacterium]|nr:hypothetical protein [Phycisphaeraceae bacterium]
MLASTVIAQPVQHIQQLLASDAADNDEYGYEVAVGWPKLAVGSPRDADGGTQSGSVYMYKTNVNGTWDLQQKITAPDPTPNVFFGQELALYYGGAPGTNLMAVGLPSDDTDSNNAGAVYVMIEGPGANPWGLNKKVYSPSPQLGGNYGRGVDIVGDVLLAGQPGSMVAYLHQRGQGGSNNWGVIATLSPPAPVFNVYAESVGLTADAAIVSDRADNSAGSETGAAYIFTKDEGGPDNWGFTKKLQAPVQTAMDQFGVSVDISGDFAAAGAQGDDDVASRSGAVYLFARDEGGVNNWGFIKKLTAPDGHTDQFFGREVQLDGDLLLVGTYNDNGEAGNAGAAYVFGRDIGGPDNWGLLQKIVDPAAQSNDYFAYGIGIDQGTIVSGVRLDDDAGFNAGSARVFSVESLCPADLNGDGMVDTADLGILLGAFGDSGLGDLNLDGVIDTADLGALLGGYGATDCAFTP